MGESATALAGLLTKTIFPSKGPLSIEISSQGAALKQRAPGPHLKPLKFAGKAVHKRQRTLHKSMAGPGGARTQAPHPSDDSDEFRTHTPEVQDFACGGAHKRACWATYATASTAGAVQSSSTPVVVTPGSSSQEHSSSACMAAGGQAQAAVCGQGLQCAAVGAVPSEGFIPQAVRPHSIQVSPFSLGVMYDAYHNNPTPDMPGYPQGYWSQEPSPFAALAQQPLSSEEAGGGHGWPMLLDNSVGA